MRNLLVNFIVVCLYPPAACKSPGLVLSFDVSYKFWIHSHLLPGNQCSPSAQILILLGGKIKGNFREHWKKGVEERGGFMRDMNSFSLRLTRPYQAINWVPHLLLEEAIGLKMSKSTLYILHLTSFLQRPQFLASNLAFSAV